MTAQPTNTNEVPHPYPRRIREQIEAMASRPDEENLLFDLAEKLRMRRSRPKPLGAMPFLGDIVFLPANLTRLVIDPYREECRTRTLLGRRAVRPLELAGPVIVDGTVGADAAESAVLAAGAGRGGVAVRLKAGQTLTLTPGIKVIRTVPYSSDQKLAPGAADAIELIPDTRAEISARDLAKTAEELRARTEGAPVGVAVCRKNAARIIPAALDAGLDFATVFCMENEHEESPWPDESGAPVIAMLTETMERIRALNREEDLDLVYFGCIQCGADIAKVLALGATATLIGQSALIAVRSAENSTAPEALENYLHAVFQEAAILARCCGKTDVGNLEPEDLRAFTIETARATGLPLVGKDRRFRI